MKNEQHQTVNLNFNKNITDFVNLFGNDNTVTSAQTTPLKTAEEPTFQESTELLKIVEDDSPNKNISAVSSYVASSYQSLIAGSSLAELLPKPLLGGELINVELVSQTSKETDRFISAELFSLQASESLKTSFDMSTIQKFDKALDNLQLASISLENNTVSSDLIMLNSPEDHSLDAIDLYGSFIDPRIYIIVGNLGRLNLKGLGGIGAKAISFTRTKRRLTQFTPYRINLNNFRIDSQSFDPRTATWEEMGQQFVQDAITTFQDMGNDAIQFGLDLLSAFNPSIVASNSSSGSSNYVVDKLRSRDKAPEDPVFADLQSELENPNTGGAFNEHYISLQNNSVDENDDNFNEVRKAINDSDVGAFNEEYLSLRDDSVDENDTEFNTVREAIANNRDTFNEDYLSLRDDSVDETDTTFNAVREAITDNTLNDDYLILSDLESPEISITNELQQLINWITEDTRYSIFLQILNQLNAEYLLSSDAIALEDIELRQFNDNLKVSSPLSVESQILKLVGIKTENSIVDRTDFFEKFICNNPLLSQHQYCLRISKANTPQMRYFNKQLFDEFLFRVKNISIPDYQRPTSNTIYGHSTLSVMPSLQVISDHKAEITIVCDRNLEALEYLIRLAGLAVCESGKLPEEELSNINNITRVYNLSTVSDCESTEDDTLTATLQVYNSRDLLKSINLISRDSRLDITYASLPVFLFQNFKIVNLDYSFKFDSTSIKPQLLEIKATVTWTKLSVKYERPIDVFYTPA